MKPNAGVREPLPKKSPVAAQSCRTCFPPDAGLPPRFGVREARTSRDVLNVQLLAGHETLTALESNVLGLYCRDYEYDLGNARRWFERATRKGLSDGKLNLALTYARGNSVEQTLAIRYLEEAASGGNARAQHWLGLCHFAGCGVARSIAKATAWFERAANQGYASSQCMLGYIVEARVEAPDHTANALAWYRKAADGNDPTAQCRMAESHYYGELGLPEDWNKAWEFAESAAGAGIAHAAYRSGVILLSDFQLANGPDRDAPQ